jgi:hypothetical protein
MGLKNRQREEAKKHIAELHEELITSIFTKIPELATQNDIHLQKHIFEKLTDEEFITLWAMPNMIIKVSSSAADYVENRRRLLGLKRAVHSAVMKGQDKRP